MFASIRQCWEEENNAILLHGDSKDKVAIPGGVGDASGPNEPRHVYVLVGMYIYIYTCVCVFCLKKSSSSLKKTQSKNGGKYTLIGLSNTPIKYVQFHSQIRSAMSPFKTFAMLSKREIVHGWW